MVNGVTGSITYDMGVGIAVSGGVVAGLGAAGIIYVESATAAVTFLASASGGQTFAIGALAYNIVAIVFAPLFGLNMEPIEYGS